MERKQQCASVAYIKPQAGYSAYPNRVQSWPLVLTFALEVTIEVT